MPSLPKSTDPFLVRTNFADDRAWKWVTDAVAVETEDGFLANLTVVDDPAFQGCTAAQLTALVAGDTDHAVLFIADATTMWHAVRPILCIDTRPPHAAFRAAPHALWSVENNLSVANMDFATFEKAAAESEFFFGFDLRA